MVFPVDDIDCRCRDDSVAGISLCRIRQRQEVSGDHQFHRQSPFSRSDRDAGGLLSGIKLSGSANELGQMRSAGIGGFCGGGIFADMETQSARIHNHRNRNIYGAGAKPRLILTATVLY